MISELMSAAVSQSLGLRTTRAWVENFMLILEIAQGLDVKQSNKSLPRGPFPTPFLGYRSFMVRICCIENWVPYKRGIGHEALGNLCEPPVLLKF